MNGENTLENFSVNVRMYCHGLGDCFLLTFKKNEDKFSMLIDCGILQGTENEKKRMLYVAEDILEQTGGKLDLVVVTHEHHDHICGFTHASQIFNEIDFEEIWLAWTEDPENQLAASLRESKFKNLTGLSLAIKEMKKFSFDSSDKVNDLLQNFSGDGLAAAKHSKRSKGLQYVLDKKNKSVSSSPRYKFCYPGKQTLTLQGLEDDVRIYVLGPPCDKGKLRDLSAPSVEKYRHHFAEMLINDGHSLDESFFSALDHPPDTLPQCSPFDDNVGMLMDEGEQDDFFENNYFNRKNDWRKIDGDWLSFTTELALKMDSYTNNTSLVLAIELIKSKKVLLFAADAQFGNWKSWHDYKWVIRQNDGTKTLVRTSDLLTNTVLYKVGHHGSHNATLRQSGLEMMTHPELVALIPVDREKAKKAEWEMPFKSLLTDLQIRTKGRVIAADLERDSGQIKTNWNEFKVDPDNKLFKKEPHLDSKKLFIDYEIAG